MEGEEKMRRFRENGRRESRTEKELRGFQRAIDEHIGVDAKDEELYSQGNV